MTVGELLHKLLDATSAGLDLEAEVIMEHSDSTYLGWMETPADGIQVMGGKLFIKEDNEA